MIIDISPTFDKSFYLKIFYFLFNLFIDKDKLRVYALSRSF